MNTDSAPNATEQVELGPLDFQSVLLLAGVSDGLRAQGVEHPPTEIVFELASRLGLRRAVARHSPGKPITGAGGTVAVEWIFCTAPYRNKAKDVLETRLSGCGGDPEVWLRDLLTPVTLWCMDLPASEANHHAYPHGLLDHSLEVALAASARCDDKLYQKVLTGELSEQAFHRAIRLCVTLGLVHDIGKVLSIEMKAKKSGEIWDPRLEPLAFFKARHELTLLESTPYSHVPGRGLNGHEREGRKLLSLVLHPKIWRTLGTDLEKVYDAYVGRYDSPRPSAPAPMDLIVDCVHQADGLSSAKGRMKGAQPGKYLTELLTKKQGGN
jgi:hypothetical protein